MLIDVSVKNINHYCIFYNSKSQAINLFKSSVLENRRYL